MVEITLITKPGCHLCDDARPVVERVVARFEGATLVERSILDEPRLAELYSDDIPVVLIDGRQHSAWRVDEAKLAERIQARLGA
ncbi:glutaredoxin family protein [Agrococcus sp. HG114]|uniref:glutaredoxin family protein n=1 Tax=Agrococcus sp. HG114 TaxID=2969757 RepID=UPI00215AB642|nr:glutaredoxin family protein [Agrococcus sp. HG114]MCR8670975.1 glutaredoxin family protein [Agrococcus sp. HG114]